MKNLYQKLKCYEGQPIKVYTDDGRVHQGVEIDVCEGAVEIIDGCGRLEVIELCHIDAVQEPQMVLRSCKND